MRASAWVYCGVEATQSIQSAVAGERSGFDETQHRVSLGLGILAIQCPLIGEHLDDHKAVQVGQTARESDWRTPGNPSTRCLHGRLGPGRDDTP